MEYTVQQLKCSSIVKKQYLMDPQNEGMDIQCSTCLHVSKCLDTRYPVLMVSDLVFQFSFFNYYLFRPTSQETAVALKQHLLEQASLFIGGSWNQWLTDWGFFPPLNLKLKIN